MRIVRRVSAHPRDLGLTNMKDGGCPDVLETDTGDFLVIGLDRTSEAGPALPADAIISKGERAILVPRATLLSAVATLRNINK